MTDTDIQGNETEGAQTEGGEAQANEVEDRARRMGWRPKEEFRGPAEKWVDAEAFMEVTANHMGMRDKELKRTIAELNELKATLRQVVDGQAVRIQREVQRKVAELEAAREQAVAAGDVGAYRKASKEIADYTEELKEAAPKQAGPSEAFQSWEAENAWYKENRRLRAFADGVAAEVMQEMGWDGKSPPTKRMYDAVAAEVRKEFPADFENPRRKAGSSTEGRTQTAAKGSRTKGWDDIPAEDRAVASKSSMIGTHSGAVYKTREDYAKSYWKTFA